ncbi:MAG: malto-oligosyltrehalose synthase [Acidimicrobiia bacterium]|nr:malto-oligosyltrehalose synthase [Acidimicrobiia bacterium]
MSSEGARRPRAPGDARATYRLQLHAGFDLDAAAALSGYLADLGVSHAYLSPVGQAVPGSTHGYDVVDPNRVSDELGGEAALLRLAARAHAAGLGLLLDIVPHHLAAAPGNRWWWSLLAEGRSGEGARFFDVDWDSPHVEPGTVLLPVLAAPLDEVLAAGELVVETGPEGPVLRYHDRVLPLAPGTADDLPSLPELLGRQHYRLAHWREAARRGNVRRFFDINDLVALRVEDPAVFEATHALVAHLVGTGLVDGLRVDHVDGLRDPAGYLERLAGATGGTWIVVEKILAPGEELPGDWPVAGTTGYEFAERAGALLVDPDAEEALTRLASHITGDDRPWEEVAREARGEVLADHFGAELDRVVRAFERALGPRPHLADALAEVLTALEVYRVYVGAGEVATGPDEARIHAAVESARTRLPAAAPLDDVARVLEGRRPGPAADEARIRFQQLSGPVAAKGVEDTALYRYVRLVSRNEVGSDPGRLALDPEAFHAANGRAGARTLLATSTHDTKRGGDVRARLHVLSEITGEWDAAARRWWAGAARHRREGSPDGAIGYLALQSLVGAWPITVDRLRSYLRKAAREAGVHTSWREPDPGFEEALDAFVEGVLGDPALVEEVEAAVRRVLVPGRVGALAQTLLGLTSPGVPDLFQGTELWDLSLVDPDNRRPVDFDLRTRLLAELHARTDPPAAALADPDDPGRPKLWTVHRALDLRRRRPDRFGPGAAYRPVVADGPAARHVVAFLRAGAVLTVVPRLTVRLGGRWGRTSVDLPGGRWRNVLDGRRHAGGDVRVADLLEAFPVALLERL